MNFVCKFKDFIEKLSIFSLDVSFGTLSAVVIMDYVYGLAVSKSWLVFIFLTCFSYYSLDRVLDAFRGEELLLSKRHFFYKKHRKVVLYVVFISFFVSVWIFYYEFVHDYLLYGIPILIMSLIHLIFMRFRWYFLFKELVVSFVYVWAVYLPLFVEKMLDKKDVIFIYFLLVLISVYLCSYYENVDDLKSKLGSIVAIISLFQLKIVLYSLFFINYTLIFYYYFISFELIYALFFLMNFMLFCSFIFKNYFSVENRHRWITEYVFYLPFLLLFF